MSEDTVMCPNAGDPAYDVDYGSGHGHICNLCKGTGAVPTLQDRIAELERDRDAACARASVVVNLFKAFAMYDDGKITGTVLNEILRGAENDLTHAAEWLASYMEAARKEGRAAAFREMEGWCQEEIGKDGHEACQWCKALKATAAECARRAAEEEAGRA